MSETKFTPGEWKVVSGFLSKVVCDDVVICQNIHGRKDYSKDSLGIEHLSEINANIHLIAASPKMYAALEKAKKQIRVFANTPSEAAVADAYCLGIDDLLAAARGELWGAK